jgi:hypothetical protein
MAEAESRRVKAETPERVSARAMPDVANDRMAELRQLDPDLMPPARTELDPEARHIGAPLRHAVPRDRDAGASPLGQRPVRIGRTDAERALLDEDVPEHALVPRHHALDDRGVPPLRVAGCELPLEASLRLGRLRDDQEARRLAVEAVDDEGTARWPRALEIRPHHAVRRALALVLGADREESRGLLDHQDRVVLVDQAERRGEGGWRRRPERDPVVRGHGGPGIADNLAAHPHPARDEPGAQASA